VGAFIPCDVAHPTGDAPVSVESVDIAQLESVFVRADARQPDGSDTRSGALGISDAAEEADEVFVAPLSTILCCLERAANLPLHRERRARAASASGGMGAVLPSDLFDDDRVWRCNVWIVVAADTVALQRIATASTKCELAEAITSHPPKFDSSFDPRLVYDGAWSALTSGVPPTLIFPLST
jgi:hypothetical protein